MLQRLIFVSAPAAEATQVERDANGAQMLFLARTLCGKIYEAQTVINSRVVSEFLRTRCFPLMPQNAGEDLRKEFNRLASGSAWLKEARNEHAVHYAAFDQWKDVLPVMDARKMGFEFVMGAVTGDTFYSSSEAAANLAFYLEADVDWQAGLKVVAGEMKALSGSLGLLIRDSLNAFFAGKWEDPARPKDKLQRKTAPKFDRVALDTFKLPYFFTLTSNNS
ncbi:hypothetical protein BSFA1_11130 [Burkholderia sp. SFA1]|nr:hypothetical protein BSFA1_11130 [Burkholderia sp. SFA1]